MADRRNLILALGAATSATALVIGGIMTANALTVDDTLGQVTATAGIGTEAVLDEATDPTSTPTPTATSEPAPADPIVSPAQPVVPAPPVDVSDDAASKEQRRDARWDDGNAANDSWWCDDAGSWHWGDHPKDPVAAPAPAPAPTTSDPGTGSGTYQPPSGDSGNWNGGSGSGYSGNGHGGGSWGGGGWDRP